MGNLHYTIHPDSQLMISDVATALLAKYGAGLTIHYQTTANLVFTCPAISDKVIKIGFTDRFFIYYGDAWTSGITITNSICICNTHSDAAGSCYKITLVLGDSFFMMCSSYSNSNVYGQIAIVAKITNGDSAVFSYQGGSLGITSIISRDITLGVPISFVAFDSPFSLSDNKIAKFPLMIIKDTGELILNGDGTQATITDLYLSSWKTNNKEYFISSNLLVTQSGLYSIDTTKLHLNTGLLAEF